MTTSMVPIRRARDRPLLTYWALAFGITWGVGGLGLLVGDITPDRPSPLDGAAFAGCLAAPFQGGPVSPKLREGGSSQGGMRRGRSPPA